MEVSTAVNQRWSMDFVADQFSNGLRFRILNIVDESATEAEVKIYKEYEGWNGEFEIVGVNKSRIIKILA